MKIRHGENIRLVLLSSFIVAISLRAGSDGIFKEVSSLLEDNIMSLDNISSCIGLIYDASVLAGFNLEQMCKDYERIEALYNDVVSNVAELMEEFHIEKDPIKVFALYVYLYRMGYLSCDKEFKYSIDMKDLPCIQGVDVVRGRGVCRSISSMFTDVCNSVGLTASNLSVRVKPETLKNNVSLSLRSLDSELKGKTFARVVGKVTKVIPLGNHLVTAIEHDNQTGIYDPTNDCIMHVVGGRKYGLINDTGSTMSYNFVSNLIPKLLGQMDTEINVRYLSKLSMEDRLAYEMYKEIYEEMNQLIRDNKLVFEDFYIINSLYYKEIDLLTKEQHGMLKRMIPIIPGRRK